MRVRYAEQKMFTCRCQVLYQVIKPLPEAYKQAFLEIKSGHQNYVQIFTNSSKVDDKFVAAAVSSVAPNSPFSCRLRDHCSIRTAELQAILFALKQAYQSQERKFMIFSLTIHFTSTRKMKN